MPEIGEFSVAELFSIAQRDYDGDGNCGDPPYDAMVELRLHRDQREVFEYARRWLTSKRTRERSTALDALCQLGGGKPDSARPFMEPSVDLAIAALEDPEVEVRQSAAWALGHLGTPLAVAELLRIHSDPDPSIRHAVALGAGMGARRGDQQAVSTLIELTRDSADEVRDWSLFELGRLCDLDTDDIRQALRAALNDPFRIAQREAIWGLAKRLDRQGLELLIHHLQEDPLSGDCSEAAEILGLKGDPSEEELIQRLRALLPPL